MINIASFYCFLESYTPLSTSSLLIAYFSLFLYLFSCCFLLLHLFLNQARANQRPAHTWFLEIAFVWEVGMRVHVYVCVCLPRAIKNYSCEMKSE